jgi:hypothetical protein
LNIKKVFNKKENFYIDDEDHYRLLKYKKHYKDIDKKERTAVRAKTVVGKNRSYIGQLILYLNLSSENSFNPSTLEYSKDQLIKLFKEYLYFIGENSFFEPELQQRYQFRPPKNAGYFIGGGKLVTQMELLHCTFTKINFSISAFNLI